MIVTDCGGGHEQRPEDRRTMILALLEMRFGLLTTEVRAGIRDQLDMMTDEQLSDIFERLLKIASLADLNLTD